jgi:hypothetical protein
MSMERRPARGTPQQIRDGAQRLGEVRKLLRIKVRGVSLDRIPRDAGDMSLRSLALAIAERADDHRAVAIARALGVDLVVLRDVLARQGTLWSAFLLVRSLLRDGRAARRLTDAARRLARAHVDATVAARRVLLDSDAQALLDDDLEEITTLKERASSEQREHAARLARIEKEARDQLKDLGARRDLLKTLASLRHGGQDLVWADLTSAAATLGHLADADPDAADLRPRKNDRG